MDNAAPVAVIAASVEEGEAPLEVDFDGSGSSDAKGEVVSYAWAFGDGSTGSGVNVSHTYTQGGTYAVRLVVYDALGRERARLVEGPVAAGWHEVRFEGEGLPSGVYFFDLEAGAQRLTRKMLLLR